MESINLLNQQTKFEKELAPLCMPSKEQQITDRDEHGAEEEVLVTVHPLTFDIAAIEQLQENLLAKYSSLPGKSLHLKNLTKLPICNGDVDSSLPHAFTTQELNRAANQIDIHYIKWNSNPSVEDYTTQQDLDNMCERQEALNKLGNQIVRYVVLKYTFFASASSEDIREYYREPQG